ncbi:MAG: hypothetical protein STHCBS139747_003681 [Sporothrix thermara]
MTAPHITVSYVGRFPIDWVPEKDDASASSDLLRRTDSRFRDFVARTLDEARNAMADDGLTPAQRAEKIKLLRVVLDRADDANSCIKLSHPPPSLDTSPESIRLYYRLFLQAIMGDLQTHLIVPWGNREATSSDGSSGSKHKNEAAGEDDMTGRPSARDAADRRAQRAVPQWYGNRCILTGTVKPQGCHILPVRAKHVDRDRIWDLITIFWDIRRPTDALLAAVEGREQENILPLTQTAHALFDAFYFALRPVAHPRTPTSKIFLQVVYLRSPSGQRIVTDWSHRKFGGLFDFRRGLEDKDDKGDKDDNGSVVQHGDVYELATNDAEAHPLPSEQFLQVQYAAHTLLSGMRAAGSLKDTFSGPPPDNDAAGDGGEDDNITGAGPGVPGYWLELIQEAQSLGILDEDAAARWSRDFARQAQQDADDAAELEAAYRDSQVSDDLSY